MKSSPTYIFTLIVLSVNIFCVLPCPPAKKTDDPQGRCCGFPFVYKGITYQSCTKVGYHRLWCSLDEGEYKGQWANCVNPCTDNPCQNGGVCTVTGDDSYCCECTDGYEGQNCEEVLPCPPAKMTDDPKGRCCGFPFVYKGITYQSCTKVGYHRLWCSLDEGEYKGQWANCVNPCTSDNPCQNGGVCTVTGDDSYSCDCADGYDGQNCEQVNPCTDNPCQNGGVCTVTRDDSYSCECADGYVGQNCEQVNPCTDNPCQNGGVCTVTGDDSYSCECADGYDGQNCEQVTVAWKSEGCFTEHKKKAKMVLKRKIATVGGKKLSIQDVFDECKSAAEKKGFKIFGIRNRNKCFTTSDGKVQEFKKYGVSSKCKIDDNGLGIGMKLANFVYTRP